MQDQDQPRRRPFRRPLPFPPGLLAFGQGFALTALVVMAVENDLSALLRQESYAAGMVFLLTALFAVALAAGAAYCGWRYGAELALLAVASPARQRVVRVRVRGGFYPADMSAAFAGPPVPDRYEPPATVDLVHAALVVQGWTRVGSSAGAVVETLRQANVAVVEEDLPEMLAQLVEDRNAVAKYSDGGGPIARVPDVRYWATDPRWRCAGDHPTILGKPTCVLGHRTVGDEETAIVESAAEVRRAAQALLEDVRRSGDHR